MSASPLLYCVLAALSCGLVAQPGSAFAQTSSQSAPLRLPPETGTRQLLAVDDNRDGVIARNEWRGAAQSFRDYDWNNDGVLSGTELQAGTWRNGRLEADIPAVEDNLDDWTPATFNRLDRNRDGRIARNEWRGNRASFTRLDANRDGVLTRREVTSTATTRRGDPFAGLDYDRNGVISASEWNSTRRSFADRDLNGDGVLTRREFAAVAPVPSDDIARASNQRREVWVESRERWTDTGVYVERGDTIAFDASGTIRMSTDSSDTATPAGSVKGRRAANAPVREALAGGLLLKIGDAFVQYVGANGSIVAPASGQLYMGVNDDHLPDNSGGYRVMVSVDHR